jgi:probable addiction module antidote protein
MRTIDYKKGLLKRLQDPEYAVMYLTTVLTEETPEAFLIAVKCVVEAREKNITALAKHSGITRQALYQALSEDGNPRFSTLTKILKSLNLKFSGLEIADPDQEAA